MVTVLHFWNSLSIFCTKMIKLWRSFLSRHASRKKNKSIDQHHQFRYLIIEGYKMPRHLKVKWKTSRASLLRMPFHYRYCWFRYILIITFFSLFIPFYLLTIGWIKGHHKRDSPSGTLLSSLNAYLLYQHYFLFW